MDPGYHDHPASTPTSGVLCIPAFGANAVQLRYRLIEERDMATPGHPDRSWTHAAALAPSLEQLGYYQIDLNSLGLRDGTYEYEFVLNGEEARPVSDPFAEEITKFGGYRGLFHVEGGRRVKPTFSWEGEIAEGTRLPQNNQIVIYEMALHWMSPSEEALHVALGTFEKVVFEHLDELSSLGINAIELMPIQDSKDTIAWGYGTRYFLAPDWDMGTPLDLKFFIKCCHQRGVRVILDVVMNHSLACPLEELAADRFYLEPGSKAEGAERQDWGGRLFRYRTPVDGHYPAREFQFSMAEFWVREYRVDGFRVDEFKGINNWDFLREFRARAWAEHERLFPDRPFIVIAEDSGRRAESTQGAQPAADSIWNFAFRDELRRLLLDRMETAWGQPPRRERIQEMIRGSRMWDDWSHEFKQGFTDLAQAVDYVTSHDMQQPNEQRLMNLFLADLLTTRHLIDLSDQSSVVGARRETHAVRAIVDHLDAQFSAMREAHAEALDRVGSAFALMLTSVGVPMFVAGEEFADIHDLEHTNDKVKQLDAVNWERRAYPGHRDLLERVRRLIELRTHHAALQRNEVEFFYFHPRIDENQAERVFAYCRTGGMPLGSPSQVVVVASCGPQSFEATRFDFPWFWRDPLRLQEHGVPRGAHEGVLLNEGRTFSVPLAPFQVRVFST